MNMIDTNVPVLMEIKQRLGNNGCYTKAKPSLALSKVRG